jgi:hypothetical protein
MLKKFLKKYNFILNNKTLGHQKHFQLGDLQIEAKECFVIHESVLSWTGHTEVTSESYLSLK